MTSSCTTPFHKRVYRFSPSFHLRPAPFRITHASLTLQNNQLIIPIYESCTMKYLAVAPPNTLPCRRELIKLVYPVLDSYRSLEGFRNDGRARNKLLSNIYKITCFTWSINIEIINLPAGF